MIEISVDTRKAVVTNKEILTSGSAGIQVQFTLSEDWTGLSKLAVFRTGEDGESIDVVLDNNLNCVVPAEALETADEVLFIGVYGSDGNGTGIIPTIWAAAGVIRPGTEPNTPAEAEPTPEIWAQILSVAQEAEATATGAMNYVEQAVSDLGTLEDRVSDNEEDRVAAEQARASAEDTRAEAETARITNEDSRINAESNRNTAEVARSMAETARADAEAARVTAEQGRVTAENERAAAEAIREEKYAEYVETVSDYADDAEASAEAARTSMVNAQSASASASQSATRANNSATIAASKANDASSWASTALNAAGNAADSQSAAAQSASAAAASQTAAETAQTAAEAAQSAAEDAQDAAETAQAAAEAAASSISGKSEQIDQNTSDIGDLSRQLSDLEDTVSTTQIINSASGAIASFSDGADGQPIRKLVAQIEPVQDLHGYDNPWPAGGGVNKANLTGATSLSAYDLTTSFDTENEIITISGTVTTTVNNYVQYRFAVFPNIQNGLGLKAFNIPASASVYVENLFWDGSTQQMIVVIRGLAVGETNTLNVKFQMVAYDGDTAPTAWTPYENICPISGHTGAEIEQTGKNLYDLGKATETINGVTYTRNDDGSYTATGTATAGANLIGQDVTLPAGVYTCSAITTGTANINASIYVNNAWKASIRTAPYSLTLNDESRVRLTLYVANGQTANITFYPQIELGSTATDYEPYTGNQISVDWETEAGTVYGGTLTVNPDRTGQLVVDRAMVDMGTLAWSYSGTLFMTLAISGVEPPPDANTVPNCICEAYKTVKYSVLGVSDFSYTIIYKGSSNVGRLWLKDSRFTDVESFKSFVTGKHICYKLANPIIYTLTESEISSIFETLYGMNNIWSSTGDTEVTYPADTKLYIDGKIADAIAALNA